VGSCRLRGGILLRSHSSCTRVPYVRKTRENCAILFPAETNRPGKAFACTRAREGTFTAFITERARYTAWPTVRTGSVPLFSSWLPAAAFRYRGNAPRDTQMFRTQSERKRAASRNRCRPTTIRCLRKAGRSPTCYRSLGNKLPSERTRTHRPLYKPVDRSSFAQSLLDDDRSALITSGHRNN